MKLTWVLLQDSREVIRITHLSPEDVQSLSGGKKQGARFLLDPEDPESEEVVLCIFGGELGEFLSSLVTIENLFSRKTGSDALEVFLNTIVHETQKAAQKQKKRVP